MKTAIVFAEGIKQIIFTPENESEEFALSLLTPDDDVEMALCQGTFTDLKTVPFTATINECKGKYLRVFEGNKESRMLVLTPKESKPKKNK